MDFWLNIYLFLDSWLMPVYRLPEIPIMGFYLGTAMLTVICVILGDFTFNLVVRADRAKIKETTGGDDQVQQSLHRSPASGRRRQLPCLQQDGQ